MKRTLNVGALCVAGTFALATAAIAQQPSSSQSTTSTQSTTMQSTSRPIQGRVVSYEAGKSIVVVGSDGREQTFQLNSSTSVPTDVTVGRSVSIVTEPSASGSGSAVVTRITTTSVGSDGSMKTETQTHVTDPNASSANPPNASSANPSSSWDSSARPMSSSQSTSTSTQTTTTSSDGTITGTVTAYEPGKSVTFVLPDKRTVVYTIDSTSVVPTDVAVGKSYSVTTVKSTSGGNGMVVKKITTTTKTTTTNP